MKIVNGAYICFVAIFLMGAPAVSHDISLSPNNLENNIFASEILVCSEVDGVTANTISLFYSEYFAGWHSLEIKNAAEHRVSRVGKKIIFLVSDGRMGNDFRSCLRGQVLLGEELEVYAEQQAEMLGQGLEAVAGLELPSYYNPISALWGYRQTNDWFIISFMSREDEPYRTNHALTNLFGLDVAVCGHSTACLLD